ncbi:hypothetical protein SISSUDRAFT_722721 [Sistotremastrum suecicum HHB10207 ss-3]|uniref:RRM domain-containing protein n=1 Tax=Sistotremastrum suecicum HHB10207 ss-3 TaxID=1314776 RepID=A0A166DLV3_9AGAM|nr:hypothetical protein SISSUDRAFT_722721 [Sistotremastrum suecicum HHB10207 ss-3]
MQNTTTDSSTPSTTLAIQNANVSLPKSPSTNVSNSLAERQSQNPLFQYSPVKSAYTSQSLRTPYSSKSRSSSQEDLTSTPFNRSLARYLTPPDSLEKNAQLDMSGQTLPEITELQSSPSFLAQYHPKESEILPGSLEGALSLRSKARSDGRSGSSLDGSASSISSLSSDMEDLHISGRSLSNSASFATAPSSFLAASPRHSSPHAKVEPAAAEAASNAPTEGSTVTEAPTSPNESKYSATSPYANPLLTTNVYINGLPPLCSEEELLNMCQPFGTVISVKTFTRNGDVPSGYGFVLFEKIDAAENCVKTLRQYRHLHPSFSKRTHRIPGTSLEAPTFTPASPATVFPNGLNSNHESFSAKMERLSDLDSTNLYIEGLPVNADANTLESLVAPHRIKSSRIFPSKLSNPPKLIAFVRYVFLSLLSTTVLMSLNRLESRDAAQDTIDNLNGRVLQGWGNTEGDKITVKFADSAEQRELRKQERMSREERDRLQAVAQLQLASQTPQSLQYPFGLQSPVQLQSLRNFGGNAGNGAPSPNLGTPQTTAELERLIDALRVTQLTNSLQQQQQNQNPLASLLASTQLQSLNQSPTLRNLHSRNLSGQFAGTGSGNFDLSANALANAQFGGLTPAQIASLQNTASGMTQASNLSDPALLNYLQSQSHTSSPSYSLSQQQQQQAYGTNLPLSALASHATQRSSPRSFGSPVVVGGNNHKLPNLQRYVPPHVRSGTSPSTTNERGVSGSPHHRAGEAAMH